MQLVERLISGGGEKGVYIKKTNREIGRGSFYFKGGVVYLWIGGEER